MPGGEGGDSHLSEEGYRRSLGVIWRWVPHSKQSKGLLRENSEATLQQLLQHEGGLSGIHHHKRLSPVYKQKCVLPLNFRVLAEDKYLS